MNPIKKFNKTVLRAIIVLFMPAILLIVILLHEPPRKGKALQDTLAPYVTTQKTARGSITFILGQDSRMSNPYYTEAANYYLHNENGKTEQVIMECHSLLEVQEYLVNHPPKNRLPIVPVPIMNGSSLLATVLPERCSATS